MLKATVVQRFQEVSRYVLFVSFLPIVYILPNKVLLAREATDRILRR